jgi:hypothetical protein
MNRLKYKKMLESLHGKNIIVNNNTNNTNKINENNNIINNTNNTNNNITKHPKSASAAKLVNKNKILLSKSVHAANMKNDKEYNNIYKTHISQSDIVTHIKNFNESGNIIDSGLGFIILRHVNSEMTNNYWKESYNKIREFYPNSKIVIIDDNSDYKYIDEENKLINCDIIKSAYPKRGELLPYYYYYKNKFFNKAVIIHDSVFIQKRIDFSDNNDMKFLWCFYNRMYQGGEYKYGLHLLNKLNNKESLIDIYNKNPEWLGCFGAMSVINHDFLKNIVEKYNLFNIIDDITCRDHRCCLERVLAVICYAELKKTESYFGVIFKYIKWGFNFENYKKYILQKDIIKVWTGR